MCAQHEALINAAFTGRPATIPCPYNTRLLDPAWIEDAYKTHPVMVDGDGGFDSVYYDQPLVVAAAFNLPLSDPPPHAVTLTVDVFALPAVRRMVTEHAERAASMRSRLERVVPHPVQPVRVPPCIFDPGGTLALIQDVCSWRDVGPPYPCCTTPESLPVMKNGGALMSMRRATDGRDLRKRGRPNGSHRSMVPEASLVDPPHDLDVLLT